MRSSAGTTSPSTASTSSVAAAPRSTPSFRRRRRKLQTCSALPSLSPDVAALVAFSALPFVGVQALADSGAGKKLAEDLEKRKPALLKAAAEAERRRVKAAKGSPLYGADRGKWLPTSMMGVSWASASHLPGDSPGDCAFDPLGLCRDASGTLSADLFDRYFELELLHARWAMLGALGALVPEALTLSGVATFAEDRWWNVGAAKLAGDDLNYLGVAGLVVAGKQGVAIIAVTQALLMSGPEIARATGVAALEPLGIFLDGQDKNWPGGGAFDPLGLARCDDDEGAERTVRLRVAEVKHGRLAMIAWLGFAAQALVGREGPLRDLVDLF